MSARLRGSCYSIRWGFTFESSFFILLEEILSLKGRSSASMMCALVNTHGPPISLGSGRSERMPITHTNANLFRGRRIAGRWTFGSHRGRLIRGVGGQHLRLGCSAPKGRV